jgi:hypothetical protein
MTKEAAEEWLTSDAVGFDKREVARWDREERPEKKKGKAR